MARLKVFCCPLGGRDEVMVAATSRKSAAALMELTHYELMTYGLLANDEDEKVALASPGAVFFRKGLARTCKWVLLRPAPVGMPTNKTTTQQLIAAARVRQVEVEGWTNDHDDRQGAEALELAAVSYRDAAGPDSAPHTQWPWYPQWWKPRSRQENLVRAGAIYQAAADTAERAGDYARRDSLLGHAASCSIVLDSILASVEQSEG